MSQGINIRPFQKSDSDKLTKGVDRYKERLEAHPRYNKENVSNTESHSYVERRASIAIDTKSSKNNIGKTVKYALTAEAFRIAFKTLTEKFQNSGEIKEAGSLLEAAAYWDKQAEIYRLEDMTNEVAHYNRTGQNLMAKGKYHEALDTFDMALKKANSTDMDIVLICDSWMGKGTYTLT